MSDCLFCKIANGEVPTSFVYEDDQVVAFNDIDPKAPVHVVIIPRQHVTTVADLGSDPEGVMSKLTRAANQVAEDRGVDVSGYRLVVNCQADGGQRVFHLHMHLLGGRRMSWPPG